jgi:2-C-methyl-D-erythritol 2,4-cyclodiphosphate synthase
MYCRRLTKQLEQVSIKATTTEKLGFVGRQEGIEAHAVVFLVPVL